MNLACQALTKGDGLGVKSSESTLASGILLRPPTNPAVLRMNMCNGTRTLTSPDPSLPSESIVMGAKIGFSPLASTLRELVQMIGTSVCTCADLGWNGRKETGGA